MSDQQVSLPFLIVLLLTIGVATRYLFFSSPSSGSRQGNNPRNNAAQNASAMRLREVAAQRIQQMFPQVDRRTILWDLQRNGGSIQATTERVLAGRLETVRRRFFSSHLLQQFFSCLRNYQREFRVYTNFCVSQSPPLPSSPRLLPDPTRRRAQGRSRRSNPSAPSSPT